CYSADKNVSNSALALSFRGLTNTNVSRPSPLARYLGPVFGCVEFSPQNSGFRSQWDHAMTPFARFCSAAATMALGTSLLYSPAHAQEEPVPTVDCSIDPGSAECTGSSQLIIVTGSRVARPDLEASSPVAVISGDSFKTFNSPSAEKLL